MAIGEEHRAVELAGFTAMLFATDRSYCLLENNTMEEYQFAKAMADMSSSLKKLFILSLEDLRSSTLAFLPCSEPEEPLDAGSYLTVITHEVKFRVAPSSKGGIDIEIGSEIIHVPKYFSAHHPLCKMVLHADERGDDFYYPKKLAPERLVHMFEKSGSSASPGMLYEAGWVSGKPMLESHNGGTRSSEFCPADTRGRTNEPSLPVIFDTSPTNEISSCSTASAEGRTGHDGFILDSGAAAMEIENNIPSVAASVDHGTDFTRTLQEKLIVDNLAGEHRNNPHFSGASAIMSSSEKTILPRHEFDESELEHHSNTESVTAERDIVKTEEASCTWFVATAAPHHATGNRALITDLVPHEDDLFVNAADGAPMQVLGSGNVVTDAVVLPGVWYVPGLTANLVSVSQLSELNYGVGFGRTDCCIRSPTGGGGLVGSARLGEGGLFEVDFLKIPLLTCDLSLHATIQ